MKVCLVSDYLVEYHDNWSGAEIVCQYLGNILQKGKVNVSYLTIKSDKETPQGVFPIPALTGGFWSFKRFLPVHLPIRTVSVFLKLMKMKPDIIHLLHSNSLFVPTMIAAKILRIPTTFTVLDYFIVCPTSHLRLENGEVCYQRDSFECKRCVSWPKLIERIFVRNLSKDLKQIITFTETSKRRLVEHGFSKEKIRVKYIYEFSTADSSEKEKEYDILFVGSFRPQKGLDVLLNALPEVLMKNPKARLNIIGAGSPEDKERIDRLIKNKGILNSVIFLGKKDNKETLEIVSKSKMVVVAEQWFSDFGPVALVEAMAQGVPVIASRIGSSPDFIKQGESGFLVEHKNSGEFAERIINLLRDSDLRKKMGKSAKATIENIFSKNQAKEIIKLYTEL